MSSAAARVCFNSRRIQKAAGDVSDTHIAAVNNAESHFPSFVEAHIITIGPPPSPASTKVISHTMLHNTPACDNNAAQEAVGSSARLCDVNRVQSRGSKPRRAHRASPAEFTDEWNSRMSLRMLEPLLLDFKLHLGQL